MDTILFINACIRQESRTMGLAKAVLSHLQGDVQQVCLEELSMQPHSRDSLQRRDALLAAGAFDDPAFRLARQFREADTIVIAAPYYDLSFPASLKLYLEKICNVGLTFYYDQQEQPQSLCRAKRMIYVSTSGAEFLPDYGFGYVRQLCQTFFHIPYCQCFYAEKLDLRDSDPENILNQTLDAIGAAMRQENPNE